MQNSSELWSICKFIYIMVYVSCLHFGHPCSASSYICFFCRKIQNHFLFCWLCVPLIWCFWFILYIVMQIVLCAQSRRIVEKLNPLSGNPRKWSNTLKTICQQQLMNCLSVFDNFLGLALKSLRLLFLHFVAFSHSFLKATLLWT